MGILKNKLHIEIPDSTNTDTAVVTVSSDKFRYRYCVFRQAADYGRLTGYMTSHGCSTCAAATVLGAVVPELEGCTPEQIIEEIEPAVFGKNTAGRNYRRPLRLQMPVSMTGITGILDRYGVKYKYICDFSPRQAIKDIEEHITEGRPAVITLRSMDGNHKWAGSVHTMVLIGMTESGKAVVCDSAYREWSGEQNQRIKYGYVEELVSFMWASDRPGKTPFYSGRKGSSGYILID